MGEKAQPIALVSTYSERAKTEGWLQAGSELSLRSWAAVCTRFMCYVAKCYALCVLISACQR